MKASSGTTSTTAMVDSFTQMETFTLAIGLMGSGQAMVSSWTNQAVCTKASGNTVSSWASEYKAS